jgi:hypothetical protein
MTILKFDGIVTYDWEDDDSDDAIMSPPRIGGRNVGEELRQAWPESSKAQTHLFVALGDETFSGDTYLYPGCRGYSEWTPVELSQLYVGDHDVFQRLRQMVGQVVTLWIADEPVNTLDPPPVR